jgi:hypothetical protein
MKRKRRENMGSWEMGSREEIQNTTLHHPGNFVLKIILGPSEK